MKNISRRNFIKMSAASGLSLKWFTHVSLANTPQLKTNSTFLHGVASGDPTQSSVIIWTRISANFDAQVHWQIALDSDFNNIVRFGKTRTSSDKDYTIKIDVSGLESGQTYYYRFENSKVYSEIGRTKTLPKGKVEQVNLAVVSCSNYPFGFFNAYEQIGLDKSIDFVLHLGDYIYEYGREGWGAEVGKSLSREHFPEHETITLQDYRQRHAQYKADYASRLMHAAHPLIPTWDDHESANNPYMNGAQNHDKSEGDWLKRRDASVQAYYEWMPIREPKNIAQRTELWRYYQIGDLLSLSTLETRHTGRTKQIDYADILPNLSTRHDRDNFMQNVLGDPSRNMISATMQDFVVNNIAQSKQDNIAWRVVGNQIPMARTHVPNITNKFNSDKVHKSDPISEELAHLTKLGELDLPIYLDTWDGYAAAREAFYKAFKDKGVQDLIVLTGDSHSFWANQLYSDDKQKMGIEIGTAGVTSPGDFERMGANGAKMFDQLLSEHNDEVLWTSCQHRGYVKLSLNHSKAKVEYLAVSTVMSSDYETSVVRTFDILKENNSLRFDI
ncbi:alkaline phosphatase D family protein [Agaribacter flavus]|uniref:Alkaline phosphatase D family protein n=1 Tax=Agaribacter flavus TaxID=1902781 RepID=A0ABV7FTM1_9ALTE